MQRAYGGVNIAMRPNVRLLAFYLPQFYPIPENDQWWGPGFTEWSQVVRGRPLFPGHVQPRLPGELGFYDLRLPETRDAQAHLAAQHGIEAFCYWHYWFGKGRTILERPLQDVLRLGSPTISFCLAWANHDWTRPQRRYKGQILIRQEYPSVTDHRRHFDTILPALIDRRYLLVAKRQLLIIHSIDSIPNAAAFIDLWRSCAQAVGLEGLHIVALGKDLNAARRIGCDGSIASYRGALPGHAPIAARPTVYRYSDACRFLAKMARTSSGEYPTIVPQWDNTPRMGRDGIVWHNTSARSFRRQCNQVIQSVQSLPVEERLVFIRSWNEWAQGNVLEPDANHGRALLEALRHSVFDTV